MNSFRGEGEGWELVEADAGDVGGFAGIGVSVLLFQEVYIEVLDLVCNTESHQKLDEVSEVFDVVVVGFVCFDVSQEDYVFWEIELAIPHTFPIPEGL